MQTVDLPQASSDLDRLKADLDEFGYAVVAGALSLEQTRQIRGRLSEQASLERKLGFEIADHVYDREANVRRSRTQSMGVWPGKQRWTNFESPSINHWSAR